MCLWLQEFFFTPFAARGRVSLQRRKEGNFSRTLHQKNSEWLNTQDCLQNQKERGTKGTDGLSEMRACWRRDGCSSTRVLESPCVWTQCPVLDSSELWAGDFEVETRGSWASCFKVGLAVGDGSLLISRVG